jgi:hypothetical protein
MDFDIAFEGFVADRELRAFEIRSAFTAPLSRMNDLDGTSADGL